MRVVLIDLNMAHYSVPLANALARKAEVIFIEAAPNFGPFRSIMDPRIRLVLRERPRNLNPLSFVRYSEWTRFINDLKPDILHFQNSTNVWFDFAFSLRRVPPMVCTVHDAIKHPGEPWITGVPNCFRNLVLRRSQGVIVHASSQRELLCSEAQILRERVHVVPHAELGSLYRAVADRSARAIRREPLTVLFFGRIYQYKGLDKLVAAMELVRKRIPQAKLLVAGRGEPVSRYLQSAQRAEWIEVIDRFILDSEIAVLFARSTMVALPYLEASQSGVATLAMGMGTPVIASAIGGLKELVRNGVDGVLVPPGDAAALAAAIEDLMTDEQKRSKLAQAAFLRCQNDLSWDEAATQTVRIYDQILGKEQATFPNIPASL